MPHSGDEFAFSDRIVALARLFQTPIIAVDCSTNCHCNAACGCDSKPGCCEDKCTRNGDGIPVIPNWEEVVTNPIFREVVASFDTDTLKTIAEFKALAEQVSERLSQRQGRRS